MQDETHDEEINLLDYWNVLCRRKKMLTLLFTASVIIAVIVSLLLPKYYESETVIIANTSDSGGLGAALSSIPLAGALAGAVGLQTPADKILVIVKSRTVADMVIRRFDLMRVFYEDDWDAARGTWKEATDRPFIEDVLKQLDNISDFRKSKEGAITISVEWKDPKLAAEIANYYVTALNDVLGKMAINTTIQVVDRAVPAEKKSRPKRSLIVALSGVMSLFIGVFIAFLLESLSKQKR
jgi:tyrosine-protein kinase Etk/Wzc